MSHEQDEKPKKISVAQVEVLDREGHVLKESETSHTTSAQSIQPSPWMLFALPVILPLVIIGFFVLMIFALLFGKTVFKVLKRNS